MKISFEEPGVYLVDDFLDDPDKIRHQVLQLPFPKVGNYPGYRTEPPIAELGDIYQEKFEKILNQKILQWPKPFWFRGPGNTQFHMSFEGSWIGIHYDESEWSAVLYLSPNPPAGTGTTIWKDYESGIYDIDSWREIFGDRNTNEASWVPINQLQNKYNRLVLYPSKFMHSATKSGFGNNMENSRLTQVFFFSTTKKVWKTMEESK